MEEKRWIIVVEKYEGFLKKATDLLVSALASKGKDAILQALVEDSIFECGVPFPIAFLSEIFWTPDAPTYDMVEFASNYPCVQFANL